MRLQALRTALAFVLLVATGSTGRAQLPAEVQLRPGDALRIAVKNEPDLSGEFPVAGDGSVMLPIVGLAQVSGRPFAELSAELSSMYARELADPEVQFTPLVRVSVLGEVRNPGLFLVEPSFTMRDVIALAGGLGPSAKRDRIEIERAGERVVAEYEAGSIDLGLHPRSGDEVFVPRRSWLSENLGIFIGAAASVAAAALTSWIVR